MDNFLKLRVLASTPEFFLPNELSDCASLFEPSCKFSFTNGKEHVFYFKFKEKKELPRGCPVYYTTLKACESLDYYVKDMMERSLIVPSRSHVVSPVLLIPKLDGSLNMCRL